MNIQEAKEEIKRTVEAYTARTAAGAFRIPVKRQRPILLIGPPGIGKTAIMEQIARECGLGLVSYTMTHHTRQSAIGLPVLEEREFEGETYTVTAYTMSEIIASVYEQMESSGIGEGILFLDEINCVSETLMPAMLQFLQYKTFCSHRLPEGWVIVAAGNPFVYNRSVREFDTVTLDRVKRMDVEPDLEVWKRYAIREGLHPAVLSFLELRPEYFYVMEAGRKGFVTGRGWEDLSEMLLTLEELRLPVEEILFGQYLQEKETARAFAFYYRLYEKWSRQLRPEGILQGKYGGKRQKEYQDLPKLPFDERLCIVWLLMRRLSRMAEDLEDQGSLAESLEFFTEGLKRNGETGGETLVRACFEALDRRRKGIQVRRDCGLLESGAEEREKRFFEAAFDCVEQVKRGQDIRIFESRVKREKAKAGERRKELAAALGNVIGFVRGAFGEGQELVILLTDLLEHPGTERVMREELSEEYAKAEAFLNTDSREEALRRRVLEEKTV